MLWVIVGRRSWPFGSLWLFRDELLNFGGVVDRSYGRTWWKQLVWNSWWNHETSNMSIIWNRHISSCSLTVSPSQMKQNVQKEGPGTSTISTSMTIQSEGKIVSYTIRCDRFPGKTKTTQKSGNQTSTKQRVELLYLIYFQNPSIGFPKYQLVNSWHKQKVTFHLFVDPELLPWRIHTP